MEFGEKICKLKAEDNFVSFSCEGARDTENRMVVMGFVHNADQRDLSSDKMDTFGKVQNPMSDLPRQGVVQINEQAPVFVHDLDLFVTVQLLDETPAILLLHQLCYKQGFI